MTALFKHRLQQVQFLYGASQKHHINYTITKQGSSEQVDTFTTIIYIATQHFGKVALRDVQSATVGDQSTGSLRPTFQFLCLLHTLYNC